MRQTIILILVLALLCSACGLQNPAPKYYQAEPQPPAPTPPVEAQASTPSDFNQQIQTEAAKFNGKVGIYAKNLKTVKAISYQSDSIFPTASTHKLVVALAIYKYIYPEVSGAKKKDYDKKIKDMMVVSDNPAFYALLDEIEKTKPDALTRVLTDLGLTKTRIHNREAFAKYGYHSVTTPYEMAVVFEAIYNEQYLGTDMSAILKEELAKTIFKEEIPRHMVNTKVLHKTGELPGTMCDVGVIDDGKDQILVSVYTTSSRPPAYISKFIADISAKIYNELRTK